MEMITIRDIYERMTEDEMKILWNFWIMIEDWTKEREASRKLDGTISFEEMIRCNYSGITEDLSLLYQIRKQLITIMKKRGPKDESKSNRTELCSSKYVRSNRSDRHPDDSVHCKANGE